MPGKKSKSVTGSSFGKTKKAVAKSGKKGHVPKMQDPPAPPTKKKDKK